MGSFSMPGNTKPTQDIDKPCWAHVALVSLQENPPKKDGGTNDAVVIQVMVLDATESSQVKKTGRFFLPNPNMSHADQGEFSAAAQVRLAQALGIVPLVAIGDAEPTPTPWAKIPEGADVTIPWVDHEGNCPYAGRQFMLKLQYGWDRVAKKQKLDEIRIDGLHIYTLEDEDVSGYPKSIVHLKMIGKEHLAKAASAPAANTASKGPAKGTPASAPPKRETTPKRETVAAGANGAPVDVDDL